MLKVALGSGVQSVVCFPEHSNADTAQIRHRSPIMRKSGNYQLVLLAPPKGTALDVAVW